MSVTPAEGSAIHAVGVVGRLLGIAGEADDPAAVERALVCELGATLGFDQVVLVAADDRAGTAHVAAGWPEPPGPGRIALVGLPAIAAVRAQREPVVVESVDALASLEPLLRAARGGSAAVSTALLVPLSARQPDYVLIAVSARPRDFSRDDIALAATLCSAGAASLAQLRLAAAHEAQAAVQAALTRAAKCLNASLDLGLVMTRICREAAAVAEAPYACFLRGDADRGLVVEAAFGLGQRVVGFRVPGASKPLAVRVAERDQPMATNDPRATVAAVPGSPFPPIGAAIAVPLHWDGELRGVLSVGYPVPGPATRERLEHVAALADLAAAAAHNASVHAGVAQAARTDGLTGCLNHGAMQEALRLEVTRAERTGGELAVILLDLDDFKRVNEENGHLHGDDVLRRVGSVLREAVRPYDAVARYGGDEFAIVVAGSGEERAADVAQRAIDRIAAVVHGPGGASAGVAGWSPEWSVRDLLAAADRALLHGKQELGRGRVVRASELPGRLGPAVSAVPTRGAAA